MATERLLATGEKSNGLLFGPKVAELRQGLS
jgi:hypothetical protein